MGGTMKNDKEDDLDSNAPRPVCRDFLRNICSRGDNCKYVHPEKRFVFCHDYQNGKCKRSECIFIHCSRDDEDHYNQYGELPPHLSDLIQVSNQMQANEARDSGVPLCKDFIKGECNRAVCKFRHIQQHHQSGGGGAGGVGVGGYNIAGVRRLRDIDDFEDNSYRKRSRFDDLHQVQQQPQQLVQFVGAAGVWTVEDENAVLRKTVAELRKRVDDLQATNEFLLEQNAQMRLGEKAASAAAVGGLAAMTVPTVTITNAPQAALRSVTASVATVPVSIAAVAATPVSLATVSMAAPGAMALSAVGTGGAGGGPSVSIAPPPPQQQQHSQDSTSQTIISTQPTPLVSYPLVARPVIPASLTH